MSEFSDYIFDIHCLCIIAVKNEYLTLLDAKGFYVRTKYYVYASINSAKTVLQLAWDLGSFS